MCTKVSNLSTESETRSENKERIELKELRHNVYHEFQ